jgi:CheY-like chemotaxis protein
LPALKKYCAQDKLPANNLFDVVTHPATRIEGPRKCIMTERKKRILIVDDEVSFTRLLKLNLEETNHYDVRVENWAEEAMTAAREFKPDLILLDVLMPRIFGGEVASRMKADPELEKIPIIFLSASLKKEVVKDHEGVIGGYPFIAKPATIEEVIAEIEKELGRGREE